MMPPIYILIIIVFLGQTSDPCSPSGIQELRFQAVMAG